MPFCLTFLRGFKEPEMAVNDCEMAPRSNRRKQMTPRWLKMQPTGP
jgi:hypothetical protein